MSIASINNTPIPNADDQTPTVTDDIVEQQIRMNGVMVRKIIDADNIQAQLDHYFKRIRINYHPNLQNLFEVSHGHLAWMIESEVQKTQGGIPDSEVLWNIGFYVDALRFFVGVSMTKEFATYHHGNAELVALLFRFLRELVYLRPADAANVFQMIQSYKSKS